MLGNFGGSLSTVLHKAASNAAESGTGVTGVRTGGGADVRLKSIGGGVLVFSSVGGLLSLRDGK
jgi:hypothetical protein